MITKNNCWIIIAAYNEQRHIADLLRRIKQLKFRNIIVVDDGSRDGTQQVAQRQGVVALRHAVNLGKGAAMKTGAEYALRNGAAALIFIDGDGQHNPGLLPQFLLALNAGNQIVFSYRRRGRAPILRMLGGRAINLIFRLLYGIRLQDSICGYRAMTVQAYRCVRWTSRDYSVESEMIARAGLHHISYTEIPIDTIYHDKYKGMTIIDGVAVLWNLLWWRITL